MYTYVVNCIKYFKFKSFNFNYFLISGLGFRPMPPEVNVESTLVWYESNKPDNFQYWVDETSKFLKGK